MVIQGRSGDVIETSTLFSSTTRDWISKAASIAPTSDDEYRRFYATPIDDDESEDQHQSDSCSSQEEDEESTYKETKPTECDGSAVRGTQSKDLRQQLPQVKGNKAEVIQKQRNEAQIQRTFDSIPCIELPLPDTDNVVLEIPFCLLPDTRRKSTARQHPAHALASLVDTTTSSTVVILTVRSGRFAGAVYSCTSPSRCLVHTSKTRYTVRRGQGKAQSAQDGNRRAQSMGSQLRRHGEVQLQADITNTLTEWDAYLQAAVVILIAIPKTMVRTVLGDQWSNDPRLCRVPLDIGRPSFESVSWIHTVLMRSVLRKVVPHDDDDPEKAEQVDALLDVGEQPPPMKTIVEEVEPKVTEPSYPELNSLHMAAQSGDADAIEIIWEQQQQQPLDPNAPGGPEWMTPLHYAAQAAAPAIVQFLLESAAADPAIVDIRDRVPYYLAETAPTRDAFRRSRAALGESYCDWTGAKVGPALTETEAEQKQARLAEKRRLKRKKQKERKAMEQAAEKAAQEAAAAALAAAQEEQEAKRVRDGLAAKIAGACDFCQTVCKGRQRANMFQRLGYKYCTSECVQNHKRELMANAAAARFGG